MTSRARVAAVAVLLLASLADCTCAGGERNQAYHAHLRSELDAYAHAGTTREVAEDARALVVDRGFHLAAWDGATRATTDWRDSGDASRERYHVDAATGSGGVAIRYTRERQDLEPPTWVRDSRRRDTELEHDVLARVYPERAATVLAEDAGDVVYDVSSAILWQSVRDALAQRGEGVSTWEAPVDVTATTEWAVHEGDDPSRVRHDVQLLTVGKGHRLQVHRTVERGSGPRRFVTVEEHRDFDAELDLVRRRDPKAAGTIETEAQARGQEAYERAVEHGAMACSVR